MISFYSLILLINKCQKIRRSVISPSPPFFCQSASNYTRPMTDPLLSQFLIDDSKTKSIEQVNIRGYSVYIEKIKE